MRLNSMTRAQLKTRARDGRSEVAGYPHQDAIFERLEVTKKYGLVSDYFVSWSGMAGRHNAKVTVWGRQGTPEDVVRHYIARLLHGLVPGQRINVAAD
jgi:hypothetical protein